MTDFHLESCSSLVSSMYSIFLKELFSSANDHHLTRTEPQLFFMASHVSMSIMTLTSYRGDWSRYERVETRHKWNTRITKLSNRCDMILVDRAPPRFDVLCIIVRFGGILDQVCSILVTIQGHHQIEPMVLPSLRQNRCLVSAACWKRILNTERTSA